MQILETKTKRKLVDPIVTPILTPKKNSNANQPSKTDTTTFLKKILEIFPQTY